MGFADLSESRNLITEEESLIGNNLCRLESLRNYQFSALELSADLGEVAEVFVRINSKGIALNRADFILTLMSVYRKEARHQLEDFAREAKRPSSDGTASPSRARSSDGGLRPSGGTRCQRRS